MFARYRVFLCLCSLSIVLTVWSGSISTFLFETQVLKNQTIGDQIFKVQAAPVQIEPDARILSVDARQLIEEGANNYSAGLFMAAIDSWETALTVYETTQDVQLVGIVSENLALAYQQLGQTQQEISYWAKAISSYRSLAQTDADGSKLGRLMIEQAQAYSRFGQQQRAIALLCGAPENCASSSALQITKTANDVVATVAALGSLGEAYRLSGETEVAKLYIEEGLSLSEEVDDSLVEISLLNSLGDVYADLAKVSYRRADEASVRGSLEAIALLDKAKENAAQAANYFSQSYSLALAAEDYGSQMRSLLDLIAIESRLARVEDVQMRVAAAIELVERLPDSYMKATAALKLAKHAAIFNEARAVDLLNRALSVGESIGSAQITSFALGELGQLAEKAGRYDVAIERTQAARLAAEQTDVARNSRYLWDWQMGRIWQSVGNPKAALQAYDQAVNLLEQIRRETASQNRTWQFDFRDTVEPIYRQYAALNVETFDQNRSLVSSDAALSNALTTLDLLQVAELQSYFANDCIITPTQTRIDAVQNELTVVINTAIMERTNPSGGVSLDQAPNEASAKQLLVIAAFPDGSKEVAQLMLGAQQLETVINQFRRELELGIQESTAEYDQSFGQQLYRWLVEPFDLERKDVQTIVFVNDGLLRSVPMAALHDGERYLIEKFAVATTPSLTLTEPKKIERPTQLSALVMGVSTPVVSSERSFPGLNAVDEEIREVSEILPNSKVLLNQALSADTLRQSLSETDYRILHLATHGTFGFEPDDNFVVLGAKREDDFNQVLTIGELDSIIREASDPTRDPIELLTLTACETAIGDERATLGLAGVAVRAGVRSAIATLWSVNDASSAALISDFYGQLQNPEITKAQALQQAQIAMLRSSDDEDRHPYRWASYILIGNWL